MSPSPHHSLVALCATVLLGCSSSEPAHLQAQKPEAPAAASGLATSAEDDRLTQLSAELSLEDQER